MIPQKRDHSSRHHRSDPERPLLFHDYIRVATDVHKAEAVIRAIKTRLPSLAYRRVLFCFLSEAANAPKCIIDYLGLGVALRGHAGSPRHA